MYIYLQSVYIYFFKIRHRKTASISGKGAWRASAITLFVHCSLAPATVCFWTHKHVYYHYHYCYYEYDFYMNRATLHQQAASILKNSNTATCHIICHRSTADWLMEFLEATIWQVAYTRQTRGIIGFWSDGPR